MGWGGGKGGEGRWEGRDEEVRGAERGGGKGGMRRWEGWGGEVGGAKWGGEVGGRSGEVGGVG